MSTTSTLAYTCPHCKTIVDVIPHDGHELVNCPACNKPFQVTVPQGEPVDKLVVPTHLEDAVPPDAEVETEPVLVAENLAEKEEPVRTVELDMFRRYPFRCLAHVLAICAGIVLAIVCFVNGYPIFGLVALAIPGFVAARLWLWWLKMRNTKLIITTKRCVLESGIFTKQATEIPLKDISEIHVGQTFVTRLFNVGDLIIGANGGERRQVLVMAVPDPKEVACLLRGQGVAKEVPTPSPE